MKFRFIEKIPKPVLLFLVTLLAYGPLLPFTGFYWDDWPFAWITHFLGPREFFPAFAPFRPFLGPIFLVTTGLIPPHPLAWQVFGLLIRFLTGLSAWFALKEIWPARPRETFTASLLFLVFPGYSQQWVALTHINQELIPLIFYLLSFWLTARALRNPKRFVPLTLGALALNVCGVFPTEYFFGLEVLRFFFIWALLSGRPSDVRARVVETLKYWWPYLLVWAANALWLVYYYRFGPYNSYAIDPGETAVTATATLASLVLAWGEALYKAGGFAWVQVFWQMAHVFPGVSVWLALALIAVTFTLLWLVNARAAQPHAASPNYLAILAGILGILAGRIPSWAAGLPLTLQSSYDRFMVSMMLGAAMLLAGLLSLIRHERLRLAAASLLIALAVGGQFLSGNVFRRDWEAQRELLWQFAWRIPALEPNTVLFTKELPLDYETDLSLTAPLNWIYAPGFQRGDALPYALLFTEKRIGGAILPDLRADSAITIPYRTVTFHGSPGQSITIYVPRNGCLRVLDPVYANADVYARESRLLTDPIALSNPTLIHADAPAPKMPAALFGPEPTHTWCYFYAKAELARQRGDWAAVAALGSEAERLGYQASDAVEWLPFIEAHARLGDLDRAERLSRLALELEPRLRKGICRVWDRTRLEMGTQAGGRVTNEAPGLERIDGLLDAFQCGV